MFVSVANLDLESATRRIEVWSDDRLLETRTITIDAQARADVIIDDVPKDATILDVRLVAGDAADQSARPDLLASDDRAWAVIPPVRDRNILVVGEGDPYLETALSYLPNSRLFGLKPSEYPAGAVRTDGTAWDLIIFEAFVPASLPTGPILAIAPPKSSGLGEVVGTLKNPGIATLGTDEPILRYVDLTTTHISEARQMTLPAWARSVIPGPKNAPLLYSGVRAGFPTAVLAFEPRQSDLPLQVAFPILLANLTGELLGGSAAPTTAISPGDPVTLNVPSGAAGLRVVAPDGRAVDLLPGAAGGLTVTYTQTDQLGVYVATPIAATAPSGSAGATNRPSPSAAAPAASGSPSGAPTAAPSGGQGQGADPAAPIRFAVDLFDVDESAIAPGPNRVLEDLGGPAPCPARRGLPAPRVGRATPSTRPRAVRTPETSCGSRSSSSSWSSCAWSGPCTTATRFFAHGAASTPGSGAAHRACT